MVVYEISFKNSVFCYRTSLEYASMHPQGGTRPPLPAVRALGSALYDNPGTLLNGNLRQSMQQQLQQRRLNINNLKSTHLSSHEHSDSGLSAESHEYSPYNSERLVLVIAKTELLSTLQSVLWCKKLLFLHFIKYSPHWKLFVIKLNEIYILWHVPVCFYHEQFLRTWDLRFSW
jgi:hypothetical protein